LCPLIETNLRRGLMLTEGSFTEFFARPIALFFLIAAILALLIPFYTTFKKHRRGAEAGA
jgi:putative tricarboxylic transport membrane protein